jgi:hypothetical protein
MNRLAIMIVGGVVAIGGAVLLSPPAWVASYLGPEVKPPRPAVVKPVVAVETAQVVSDPLPVNPLAATAVDSLNVMVERPLFNPTRAPPPPPVAMAEPEPVAAPEPVVVQEVPVTAEDFTLIGVSIRGDESTAVIRWNKSNEVFHLKAGQFLSDWELKSVESKAVIIARADTELTIRLFQAPRRPAAAAEGQGQDEQALREQAAQEQAMQEQALQEQAAREQAAQQQAVPEGQSQ